MATIDNKDIIDNLIKNNGYYEDDPRVVRITQYINQFGIITWGVEWNHENRYIHNPPYVNNPKVVWEAK